MDWVSWAEVKGEEGVYRGQVPVFIKPRRSAVQFLSSAALISGCAPDGHLPFVEFFALHVSQRAIRQIWIWVKRPGGILASARSKKTPLALVSVLAKIEALVFSQPYSSTGVQNYKPRRWGGRAPLSALHRCSVLREKKKIPSSGRSVAQKTQCALSDPTSASEAITHSHIVFMFACDVDEWI